MAAADPALVAAAAAAVCPIMPLSAEGYDHLTVAEIDECKRPRVEDCVQFGLVGFCPNAIGQSEDLWAVLHQTHNLIGVGFDPRFGLARAPANKLREYFNSLDIASAATR